MNNDIQILNAIKKYLESTGNVDFVGFMKHHKSSSSQEFWYDNAKYEISVQFLKDDCKCKNMSVEERE